ncbi:hypothetical protein G5B30_16735 [Sphingobacterium sp. SGG-5]|uniref:hypothetical protein n=1 Tax=Sphingobacterium sp. SGG-5 TaxID=2710881 RepID=UPI0013ED42F4|nr:hypothetical protein [Sphingobacterium sp. SGG-5]NGM63557.1 hypothetical protein [Sphingobacterium sp. SGG-5]
MKNLLVVSFSFILFVSCHLSNEDKAKELIKQYIVENANDPESYEPVEFGDLKEEDGMVFWSSEYNYLEKLLDVTSDEERKEYLLKSIDNLVEEIGEGSGYSIVHSYRGNNAYGAKILVTQEFYLDSMLTKVLFVENF